MKLKHIYLSIVFAGSLLLAASQQQDGCGERCAETLSSHVQFLPKA
jgi:hypothetical protein